MKLLIVLIKKSHYKIHCSNSDLIYLQEKLSELISERDRNEATIREELSREAAEAARQQEKILCETMKRQRDRDIERAMKEMQQQAQTDLKQRLDEAEHRYR